MPTWEEVGRQLLPDYTPEEQRAFLLAPGTKVDVIETIDGDKYGSPHIMYKIKTADGRTGWVPKKWCKQFYK